jgi:lysophospholipase L1-like esterase
MNRITAVLSLLCASLAAVAAALGLQWWRAASQHAAATVALAEARKVEPFRLATAAYPRANDGRLSEGNHQRHLGQTAAAEASAKEGGKGLVLVGDSITHAWEQPANLALLEGLPKVVNLGTGGDRTENVLWRLRNGNLPKGLDPRAFVVMIGTNNTGHRMDKPEDIAAGVVAILDEIQGRFPRTPVILYRIFPRGAQADDKMRLNNQAANERVAKAVAGRTNVSVRDLAPKLLQPDGTLTREIMPDLLHLSKKGYEIWAADLREALK